MKTCIKCITAYPYTWFYKDSQKKDGYQPYCKECSRKHDRERYDFKKGKTRTCPTCQTKIKNKSFCGK